VVNFNIRDFPDELKQRIDRKVANEGITLHAFAVRSFEAQLRLKADGKVDDSVSVTCPLCGLTGPLLRFGPNARCFHCGTGFMPPQEAA
jgi:transposase